MSWGGYIPGDLIREIDPSIFYEKGNKMNENYFLYKAAYLISNKQSWEAWSYKGYGNTTWKPVRVEDAVVTVLDTVEDTREVNGGYYDEYPQGSTAPGGIRFRVDFDSGETLFLQKDGEYDSYGSVRYDGKLREVKPVEKTVTVYEFA